MMRIVCMAVLAVSLAWSAGKLKMAHEIWNLKLTGEGGVQTFERPETRIWARQQGILFLTPERFVVYQVNRLQRLAPLQPRAPSGGGGNFYLLARFFDVHTGHEIKRMQFLTGADYSSIVPTHDGQFLVRTGNLLSLFSQSFGLVRSRDLPFVKDAPLEYWQVGVTASGHQIVLVHQRRFFDLDTVSAGGLPLETSSEADVEMLDADTFELTRKLHLSHYLPTWSARDQSLLTLNPQALPARLEFGFLDFEGNWAAVHPPNAQDYQNCSPNMDLLQHDLIAARGCGGLSVFSDSGEKVLTLPDPEPERFESVASAGHYLVFETGAFARGFNGRSEIQPSQIQIYDLDARENIAAIKLKTTSVSYALSTEGILAVVDGDMLRIYQP